MNSKLQCLAGGRYVAADKYKLVLYNYAYHSTMITLAE